MPFSTGSTLSTVMPPHQLSRFLFFFSPDAFPDLRATPANTPTVTRRADSDSNNNNGKAKAKARLKTAVITDASTARSTPSAVDKGDNGGAKPASDFPSEGNARVANGPNGEEGAKTNSDGKIIRYRSTPPSKHLDTFQEAPLGGALQQLSNRHM